jgi:hypothetical protein
MLETWRQELRERGFSEDCGMYRRGSGVVAQALWETPSRLRAGAVTITAAIEIVDRFLDGPAEIAIKAYVNEGGVVTCDAGIPPTRWVPEEGARLRRELPSVWAWLDQFAGLESLIRYFELGLQAGMRPALPQPVIRRPPVFHLYLSFLYEALGDRTAACHHATAWYEQMKQSRQPGEPDRSLRQLAALGCDSQ